jgi:hypothetical protein
MPVWGTVSFEVPVVSATKRFMLGGVPFIAIIKQDGCTGAYTFGVRPETLPLKEGIVYNIEIVVGKNQARRGRLVVTSHSSVDFAAPGRYKGKVGAVPAEFCSDASSLEFHVTCSMSEYTESLLDMDDMVFKHEALCAKLAKILWE